MSNATAKAPRDVIEVRPYSPDDARGINRLFNRVFAKQRPLAMWQWRFQANPATLPSQIVVADRGGEIVGQYAAVARDLLYRQRPTRGLQILDNIIDKAYRTSFQLQIDMFHTLVDHAAKEGADIGYGFPNEIAYRVGKRLLKYEDVGTLAQGFRRLNWRLPLVRRVPLVSWFLPAIAWFSAELYRASIAATRSMRSRAERVREVSCFDYKFDELWEESKSAFVLVGVRDAAYLTWRFTQRPGWTYLTLIAESKTEKKLTGYMVISRQKVGDTDVGYIVDFLAPRRSTFLILLRAALSRLTRWRVDYCLCLAVPGTASYTWLKQGGFDLDRRMPGIPLVCYAGTGRIDERDCKRAENWFLTYGDTEII